MTNIKKFPFLGLSSWYPHQALLRLMDKFVHRMEALTYNHSEALNPGVMMRPSKQSPKHPGREWSVRDRFSCHQRARSQSAVGRSRVSQDAQSHGFALHLGVPGTRFENRAISQQLCPKHLSFVLFLFHIEKIMIKNCFGILSDQYGKISQTGELTSNTNKQAKNCF